MGSQTSSLVFLQYLTTVFDTIGDAIMLIGIEPDDRYRLLTANETFHRTTGFTRDSIGKFVSDVVAPKAYQRLTLHYKDAIIAKKPVEFTEWSTLPAGRRACHVQLIPILNSVGECAQLAVVAQDVTELEMLREQNKLLQQQIQQSSKQ